MASIFCLCNDCGYSSPLRSKIPLEAIILWNELAGQKSDATSPAHYNRWKIEPLDFIMANDLDFVRGNIIKYIMRYDAKGGLEDLKKARVYLDRLIEKVEKGNG